MLYLELRQKSNVEQCPKNVSFDPIPTQTLNIRNNWSKMSHVAAAPFQDTHEGGQGLPRLLPTTVEMTFNLVRRRRRTRARTTS